MMLIVKKTPRRKGDRWMDGSSFIIHLFFTHMFNHSFIHPLSAHHHCIHSSTHFPDTSRDWPPNEDSKKVSLFEQKGTRKQELKMSVTMVGRSRAPVDGW